MLVFFEDVVVDGDFFDWLFVVLSGVLFCGCKKGVDCVLMFFWLFVWVLLFEVLIGGLMNSIWRFVLFLFFVV